MDDNCGEWVEGMGVASGCGEQEVGVASGSGMESMGVATGCGFKEIYRFPHTDDNCGVGGRYGCG